MKHIVFACLFTSALAAPAELYSKQQYQQSPQQQSQQYSQQSQQQSQQYSQQSQQQIQQSQQDQYQPLTAQQKVPIVAYENQINFDGSFKYSFEGGDGTKAAQQGGLKQVGQETGEVAEGAFSFNGDDGKTYSLTYTADENGFQPIADYLPTSPPIPDAIAKSLAFLATKPPSKEDGDEKY